MTGGPVRLDRHDATLVVTIDRANARNAIDKAVAEAIERAMNELDANRALSAGVITGAGGYFSAGMDLKAFARGERPFTESAGFAGIVERPPRKVLIAAVEGFALAGGLEIALACDLIVAARGALLGIPEVKRGILAAGGALLHLPRRIPYHLAMELAVTGNSINAERGFELGLVNRLTEPGEALGVALELSQTVASNAPLAVEASKQIIRRSPSWPEEEAWERQAQLADPVYGSDDAQEGPRAFAQKRPPRWRGH